MDSKSIFLSRTFWVNLLFGVLALLADHIELLRGMVSDGGYFGLLLASSISNIVLRTQTNTAVKLK